MKNIRPELLAGPPRSRLLEQMFIRPEGGKARAKEWGRLGQTGPQKKKTQNTPMIRIGK